MQSKTPSPIRDAHAAALTALSQGHAGPALASAEEVVRLAPQDPASFNLRGVAHLLGGGSLAALADFDHALALDPADVPALDNQSRCLLGLGRLREASASLSRLLALAPRDLDARTLYADLLRQLGDPAGALREFEAVLRLDARHPLALQASASLLHQQGNLAASLPRFEALWQLTRDDYALGMIVSTRRALCAWQGLDALEGELLRRIRDDGAAFNPFLTLMVTDDPGVQASNARSWWPRRFGTASASPYTATPKAGDPRARLRIGYLGGDLRDHPTAWLMAGVLEAHDRVRFEVRAYSTSPDDGSEMRARLTRAFDSFVEVEALDDTALASRIADDGIDILVDLSGHTDWARGGVMQRRPAPVSAHYLGYPGPLGTRCVDYFIADAQVLPASLEPCFDQAIARLPGCYQANGKLEPTAHRPTREAEGLPPGAFVYCGFSQSVKLSRVVFDAWMRILASVPGSVLWLLEDSRVEAATLRREAALRGIDPARLVFAARRGHATHLARFGLADLLLDTWPCGAHTTASDSLREGVPFITWPGTTFASRVGASLLRAMGLEELVVAHVGDYERMATALGTDPPRHRALVARVRERVQASTLFDPRVACRHLEAAYAHMWAVAERGEAPRSFEVGG